MEVFLVGGAVRDKLMGRDPKDRDFVVVGSSVEEMLSNRYDQVGADFPVFLHPISGEEYALARRERKTGAGYGGFETDTSNVTIEEDLSRRDLTVNSMAIAVDRDGELIDPFGGHQDLENKILRHTSEAFSEDPLRVVRLARFFSRYQDLGFYVAPETMDLAWQMVEKGMLNEISHERFWAELEKAFADGDPTQFFVLLYELGAFENVQFFKQLFGGNVKGPRLHQILNLAEQCQTLGPKFGVEVFAALVVPLDGALNLPSARSTHIFHGMHAHAALSGPPTGLEVATFFTRCHAYNEGTKIDDVLTALKMVERAHNCVSPYTSSVVLRACLKEARSVTAEPFMHLEGRRIGDAMMVRRATLIDRVLHEWI